MQITAYNFSKEPNSTKQPTTGRDITCVLKNDCSIIRPVFELSGYSLNDNYVKWDNRYYWIEDIVFKTNNIAEYHCREDVLATFKSYIGSSSQYIVRSAHAHTGSIIDMKYPATTSITKNEVELTTLHSSIMSTGFYVVGIQNGITVDSGGVTYYVMNGATFRNLLAFMYGGTWLDTTEAYINLALQKELINPMQYISSITWFPMSMTIFSNANVEPIKFGWWNSNINAKILTPGEFVQTFSQTVTLHRHPAASTRGTYLNGNPFTRYTLFCYTFGQIPIDANMFTESSSLTVSITVDLSTGKAKLQLVDASARVLRIYPGYIGQNVQIAQLTQGVVSPIASVVGGGVTAGLTMNITPLASGIVSGIQSMVPQIQTSGESDSRLWYYRVPTILSEHIALTSEDNEHLGRPLCVRGTISSYPGYNEIENPDLDIPANFMELEEIRTFMQSGFYYE